MTAEDDRLWNLLSEMRREMRSDFDRVFQLLDTKADKSDLVELKGKVDLLDNRVQTVEQNQNGWMQQQAQAQQMAKSRTDFRQWAVPTVLSALIVLVYILQLFGIGTHGAKL